MRVFKTLGGSRKETEELALKKCRLAMDEEKATRLRENLKGLAEAQGLTAETRAKIEESLKLL